MFLKRAEEKHASPDQLDQLLRIVKPKTGWLLGLVGMGIAIAAGWAWFGEIPLTVKGEGILVYPKKVVSKHAPATGRIEWLVKPGKRVEVGEVLAKLSLDEVVSQHAAEIKNLAYLERRETSLNDMAQQRAAEDREYFATKKALLGQRIDHLTSLAGDLASANKQYEEQQSDRLKKATLLSERLRGSLEERMQAVEKLKQDKLTTADVVLDARREIIDNDLKLAELEVKSSELDLRRIQAQESHLAYADLIRDLEIQVAEIELRVREIDRTIAESELDNRVLIEESKKSIEVLQGLIDQSEIRSESAGIVLEVTAARGEVVPIGRRICSVLTADESGALLALAYFSVADGKKITPGSAARVTPATIRREMWGSVVGRVAERDDEDVAGEPISQLPHTVAAAANEIGSRETAEILLGGRNRIAVYARLDEGNGFDGYQWTSTSGPPADEDYPPLTVGNHRGGSRDPAQGPPDRARHPLHEVRRGSALRSDGS